MTYAPAVTADRLTDEEREKVTQNERLVWYVVNRLTNMPGDEDAFAAGVCGLAKAVRNYDPEAGFAFSTYAVPIIRSAIQRDPLIGSSRRGTKGHASRFRAVSLNSSVWRDSQDGDGVYLQTNDAASRVDNEIEDLIDHLFGEQVLDVVLETCVNEREFSMIWDWVVEGLNYSEIGEHWNLSRERVRQIVNKVMQRVRVSGSWQVLTIEGCIPC